MATPRRGAANLSAVPDRFAKAAMGAGFFPDSAEEDDLEHRNQVFWTAMIDHIRRDGFLQPPRRILDVGSHRGGLLAQIAQCWAPNELFGIEPNEVARARAHLRLRTLATSVVLLDPSEWRQIPDGAVDLVVCHEVLFLIPDLDALAGQLARVLCSKGRAYYRGYAMQRTCHGRNGAHSWSKWDTARSTTRPSTFWQRRAATDFCRAFVLYVSSGGPPTIPASGASPFLPSERSSIISFDTSCSFDWHANEARPGANIVSARVGGSPQVACRSRRS